MNEVEVCLVQHEGGDVGGGKAMAIEQGFNAAGNLTGGLQDYAAAGHAEGRAEGQGKIVGELAVGGNQGIHHLEAPRFLADETGSGAISKEHGDAALDGLHQGNGRHFFAGDDKHLAVTPREVSGEVERDQRTGACHGHIQRGDLAAAQRAGDIDGWAGESPLRGAGGADEIADVRRAYTRRLEALDGSGSAHGRDRILVARESALLDARDATNPFRLTPKQSADLRVGNHAGGEPSAKTIQKCQGLTTLIQVGFNSFQGVEFSGV